MQITLSSGENWITEMWVHASDDNSDMNELKVKSDKIDSVRKFYSYNMKQTKR